MPLTKSYAGDKNHNKLSPPAECFYARLRDVVDDHAFFDADPLILKSRLYPLKRNIRESDISRLLHECKQAGVARLCRGLDGRFIVHLPGCEQTKKKSMASDFVAKSDGQLNLMATHPPNAPPPVPKQKEEKEGRNARASGENIESFRANIGNLYRREATDRWTYAEETALAEVCRRPAAMAEWEQILAWRRSMPLEDRRRFFPQSVLSLLSRWTESLDKARVQCPARGKVQGPRSKVQSSETRTAADADPRTLRESIEYLEREHPKSDLLPKLRAKLKELEGGAK